MPLVWRNPTEWKSKIIIEDYQQTSETSLSFPDLTFLGNKYPSAFKTFSPLPSLTDADAKGQQHQRQRQGHNTAMPIPSRRKTPTGTPFEEDNSKLYRTTYTDIL